MKTPVLTKNFLAGGTINPYRIVKFGSDDNTVILAAAATDSLLGVVDIPAQSSASSGERVDVVLTGVTEVEYGGTVTRGQELTSDANGRAVAASPAAGVNNRIIGIALKSGVVGDIGSVLLSQSVKQG